MSVVKRNTYVPGTNNDITNVCENVDLNRLGFDETWVALESGSYKVKTGSIFECNGSMYAITADITVGNTSSSGFLAFNSSTLTFSITTTAPTFEPTRAGFYTNATTRVLRWDILGSNFGINPPSATRSGVISGVANSVGTDRASVVYGFNNNAQGTSPVSIGSENVNSVGSSGGASIGRQNTTGGTNASALGNGNVASAQFSSAVGRSNQATQTGSSALGFTNSAQGTESAAVGSRNNASNTEASAIGAVNNALNQRSSAIGNRNNARGDDSSAVGRANLVESGYTHASAFGSSNIVTGNDASAFGRSNTVRGNDASAFGRSNTVTAGSTGAVAMGLSNEASASNASAVGRSNTARSPASSAMGSNNTAVGLGSSALGFDNTTSQADASAIGKSNSAINTRASAFGNGSTASGVDSSAFGRSASATGNESSAFGRLVSAPLFRHTTVGYSNSNLQLINKAVSQSGVFNYLNDLVGTSTGSTCPGIYYQSISAGGKVFTISRNVSLYKLNSTTWEMVNENGATLNTYSSASGSAIGHSFVIVDIAR